MSASTPTRLDGQPRPGTRSRRPCVLSRFHGRPWAGAFNVVMATTIVSIAAQQAGLEPLSVVLLWLGLAAFALLATLDVLIARHPLTLLRQAGNVDRGFHALGFVAAGCVVGVRIAASGPAGRACAALLLACGAVVWLLILGAVVVEHGRAGGTTPRGEWLLTVVATEGLAILVARLAVLEHRPSLHDAASVLWIAGGVTCLVVGALLVRRATRPGFGLRDVSPDWWIVMGAPAIWCVAAVVITGGHPATAGAAVAETAWGVATVMLVVIATADGLRAARFGVRFSPERWTMVFPLGMYSLASQLLGRSLHAEWLTDLGRAGLAVALIAWALVAAGELRHLVGWQG